MFGTGVCLPFFCLFMTNGAVYSLSDVAAIVDGQCVGADAGKQMIRFLLIDSRKLFSPKGSLFFALKSKKNDGHRYVEELLQKGVRAFVTEKVLPSWVSHWPDACFIKVSDGLAALQQLAASHRSQFECPLVAITGSNGKTVIKEWLYQSLCEKHPTIKNPKSYNSQIGVPLSVWLMAPQHELAIFEAGISRKGEMHRLQQILRPHTGIFTNIGPAHDEGFSSREEKIREKLLLFEQCKALIYCSDHRQVHDEIIQWHKDHPGVELFSWGLSGDPAIKIVRKEKVGAQTMVSMAIGGRQITMNVPFVDDASVENALHMAVWMVHAGYPDNYVASKAAVLQPVAMRMEMKEGVNQSIVINDSYNSDLYSLGIALDFLVSQAHQKKRTLILSDILQSGMDVNELYAEVASLVRSKKVERFIGIGPDITSAAEKFSSVATFFKSTDEFVAQTDFDCFHNEAILLKGARKFGFERVSTILQQKDHQTVMGIDLDALTHNLNVFRSLALPSVKLMAMVKAFSYGSGSVEVARMMQYQGVDYLAVAYADEGKELRQGGVHIPVMVMNPEVRSFDTLLSYRLEPEIYGFRLLRRFLEAAERHPADQSRETEKVSIHIKIDTGMHRLGFLPHQTDELTRLIAGSPAVRVASVFSHLAASDDPVHDAFTRYQIDLFEQVCAEMEAALGYSFIRHICNSSAISRFPGAHFDMVRPGIGLYGVSNDPVVQPLLQNVSTFRSVVSQVKQIRKGETVGYDRALVAGEDMTIAIVPVGYADGLDRRLGNGMGCLLAGGKRVPIVGNISMDMCAIDVTRVGVQEGDEVIVFGDDLSVKEVARKLDTIPYEVLTSVSRRVKRVYYQA